MRIFYKNDYDRRVSGSSGFSRRQDATGRAPLSPEFRLDFRSPPNGPAVTWPTVPVGGYLISEYFEHPFLFGVVRSDVPADKRFAAERAVRRVRRAKAPRPAQTVQTAKHDWTATGSGRTERVIVAADRANRLRWDFVYTRNLTDRATVNHDPYTGHLCNNNNGAIARSLLFPSAYAQKCNYSSRR